MAGHSKWANIKHRKGAQDARRAKVFTKVAREISVAAREGGGDPENNSRLRSAIAAARAVNMSNDRIDKAVKKGTGESAASSYEQVVYEGYGPGGVAIFVNALTDNRNRTTAEVRHLLTKFGGELGAPNSVAWMFDRKGSITVPASAVAEEGLLEIVLEAGAEDVTLEGSSFEIVTPPDSLDRVRDALEAAEVPMSAAEMSMLPQNFVPVEGAKAETLLTLLSSLEDHDDVQQVSANCEVSEAAAES
ncbi:MAG: YebC/PmpR family DNA-binding transcriptional regulator [Acidobacteriota bacterium]|nr:YebC/PmpR family DNA-binding transcriptional regulator [Acidobacteriota bacterium]